MRKKREEEKREIPFTHFRAVGYTNYSSCVIVSGDGDDVNENV